MTTIQRAGATVAQLRPRPRSVAAQPRAVRGPAVLSYYLIGGATLLLLAIGIVMVLSASSVSSIRENEGNPYVYFLTQAQFAVIGLPLLAVASRIPVAWYRRLAWPAMIGAMGLQTLIFTPLARGEKGNTNWVFIPGVGQTVQPSEFLKLGLALWLGIVLTRKAHLLHHWLHVLIPGVLGSALALALVLGGRDLGTAAIMAALVGGAMFVGGVPLRWFAVAAVGAAGVAAYLVAASGNRLARFAAVFGSDCDQAGACYQSTHGLWGLGTGGI